MSDKYEPMNERDLETVRASVKAGRANRCDLLGPMLALIDQLRSECSSHKRAWVERVDMCIALQEENAGLRGIVDEAISCENERITSGSNRISASRWGLVAQKILAFNAKRVQA